MEKYVPPEDDSYMTNPTLTISVPIAPGESDLEFPEEEDEDGEEEESEASEEEEEKDEVTHTHIYTLSRTRTLISCERAVETGQSVCLECVSPGCSSSPLCPITAFVCSSACLHLQGSDI